MAFLGRRDLRPAAVALALAAAAAGAWAHDTWLRVDQQANNSELVLQLATGARFPVAESTIAASHVKGAACVTAEGDRRELAARRELPQALELASRTGGRAAACALEVLAVELDLAPALVEQYMHDVRAPPAVRDAWSRQLRAGGSWREVYRKYARIETAGADASPQALGPMRVPRGFPLELVPAGSAPLRAQVPAAFTALSDGKPVAGLAVEFVSERSAFGIWRQTGADGRVELTLPFAGNWLLRSTAFDLPDAEGVWRTRFATLNVQVR